MKVVITYIFRGIKKYVYRILIVLQKDDYKAIKSLEKFSNIKLLFQKINGYGAALIEVLILVRQNIVVLLMRMVLWIQNI